MFVQCRCWQIMFSVNFGRFCFCLKWFWKKNDIVFWIAISVLFWQSCSLFLDDVFELFGGNLTMVLPVCFAFVCVCVFRCFCVFSFRFCRVVVLFYGMVFLFFLCDFFCVVERLLFKRSCSGSFEKWYFHLPVWNLSIVLGNWMLRSNYLSVYLSVPPSLPICLSICIYLSVCLLSIFKGFVQTRINKWHSETPTLQLRHKTNDQSERRSPSLESSESCIYGSYCVYPRLKEKLKTEKHRESHWNRHKEEMHLLFWKLHCVTLWGRAVVKGVAARGAFWRS